MGKVLLLQRHHRHRVRRQCHVQHDIVSILFPALRCGHDARGFGEAFHLIGFQVGRLAHCFPQAQRVGVIFVDT